jgi:hypothetical protein
MTQLEELQNRLDATRMSFEIEKNAKNEAYLFILQSGNFERYSEWTKKRRQQGKQASEAHGDCIIEFAMLAQQATEPIIKSNKSE